MKVTVILLDVFLLGCRLAMLSSWTVDPLEEYAKLSRVPSPEKWQQIRAREVITVSATARSGTLPGTCKKRRILAWNMHGKAHGTPYGQQPQQVERERHYRRTCYVNPQTYTKSLICTVKQTISECLSVQEYETLSDEPSAVWSEEAKNLVKHDRKPLRLKSTTE